MDDEEFHVIKPIPGRVYVMQNCRDTSGDAMPGWEGLPVVALDDYWNWEPLADRPDGGRDSFRWETLDDGGPAEFRELKLPPGDSDPISIAHYLLNN